MARNTLYYGDNLDIIQRYLPDESVDLIYLDPPFNSDQDYNVLFAEKNGSQSRAQIKAFEDTWHWDQAAAESYQSVVEAGGQLSLAMQAFRTFLGDNDMLAYLSMMAPRLAELRRVLKPHGSIYLHCDPTASHYLKMLMDAVFGPQHFLNEIIWYYRGAGVPKMARARRHDVLLWYAKRSGAHYFDPDPVRQPYAEATRERFSHYIGNVRGERDYGQQSLNPKGKHPDDVITHIQPIAPSAKARLGYPTQKPDELLDAIVASTSRVDDVVLDPFCGCGTAVVAAQRLNRKWIGIDITHLAITLIKHRLASMVGDTERFGDAAPPDFDVVGEPTCLADAQALAEEDPYQFQWWALGLVGARPADQRQGADQGIDGRLFFHDEGSHAKTKQIIFSVKSGGTSVAHVRDLRGVLERERAQIGVLLTLREPTAPMRKEAAGTGFYDSPGWRTRHPRLQVLTIEELLDGRRVDCPPLSQTNTTFRKPPKVRRGGPDTIGLPLDEEET